MDYFTGKDEWELMLTGINHIPDDTYLWLQYATNPYELHMRLCEAGIFETLCSELSADVFSNKLCTWLISFNTRLFEKEIWDDEWLLVKYSGNYPYVKVPEDFAEIGDEAFMGHAELREVRLPEGCYGIGERAFAGCANLVEINLPEKCDWVGAYSFSECRSLHLNVLPPLLWISEGAFQYCISLQNLEIPVGVTEIGKDAFRGCTNLVILCKENSCAHRYAQENGIPYKLQV